MGVKTSSQSAHSQSKPVVTERTPRLFEECARLTDSCQDRNLLLSRIATLLSQRGLADFLILVRRENSGKWIAEGLLHPAEKSGGEFLETMMNLAEKAVLEKRSIEIQEGRTSGFRLAATPIPAHPRAEEALVAILGRPLPQTVGMIPPLETVAAAISRWDAWKAFQLSDDLAENAFAVVELVARAQAASDEQSTALKVVQQLAEFLDTSHCAIVKTPPQGAPELLACADDTIASNDGEQSQFISHAGLEATLQGGVLTWHASEGTSAAGMLPLRRLAMATHAASVVAIPLTNQEGRSYGAFVFWGDASLLEPRDAIRFLSAAAEPVTELLMAKQRAAGGWLRRLVDQLESGWKSSRRSLLIGAIGMLTLMLMIPCPYWVACDCEVQPVHRRFLAAPFDSKLQESFVEPGDVVSQGQVLARLDERDVDWELAGIEAELQRLRKERDGHVAAAKYGEAEVDRFEIERLAVRQDFYLARFEELEVRSPIDGIVIAGDLKKTEGAPLEQGQTLFEIAPLDEMTVEVRIPEKEISYVSEEMWVEARFDSWPGRKWSGSLNRLQPRGEVLDDQQVFRGEIPIDNGLAMLRPGMHGRAWIRSATRPLGWNLFHHAWEQTQIWMGW